MEKTNEILSRTNVKIGNFLESTNGDYRLAFQFLLKNYEVDPSHIPHKIRDVFPLNSVSNSEAHVLDNYEDCFNFGKITTTVHDIIIKFEKIPFEEIETLEYKKEVKNRSVETLKESQRDVADLSVLKAESDGIKKLIGEEGIKELSKKHEIQREFRKEHMKFRANKIKRYELFDYLTLNCNDLIIYKIPSMLLHMLDIYFLTNFHMSRKSYNEGETGEYVFRLPFWFSKKYNNLLDTKVNDPFGERKEYRNNKFLNSGNNKITIHGIKNKVKADVYIDGEFDEKVVPDNNDFEGVIDIQKFPIPLWEECKNKLLTSGNITSFSFNNYTNHKGTDYLFGLFDHDKGRFIPIKNLSLVTVDIDTTDNKGNLLLSENNIVDINTSVLNIDSREELHKNVYCHTIPGGINNSIISRTKWVVNLYRPLKISEGMNITMYIYVRVWRIIAFDSDKSNDDKGAYYFNRLD